MPIRSSSNKNKVYKFIHRQDEYIKTTLTGIEYTHKDGWVSINPDGTIHFNTSCLNGYAWDGCTPKWEILDLVVGTPDGTLDYLTEKPITYYASMVHDIFYQFKAELPVSRWVADRIFYLILKEAGFSWTWLYYYTIRIVAGTFGKWKSKTKVRDLKILECSWIKRVNEEVTKLS